MIEAAQLTKSFDELKAVDDVSFTVDDGEIYGLLGPNGAGKTTTLSMLSGLLAPDSGRVRFAGLDLAEHPFEVKSLLGVVPQENALYDNLSAREHLSFWAGLYGLSGGAKRSAIDRVLDDVGLTGRADEAVERFSGGMKRRLNLALGLVHSPKAVLLDEPTVGIDPQARLNILETVRQVADAGTAVLYTTHYLDEVERLCDRIGILDHGQLLAEGTLAELQRMVGGEEIVKLRGRLDAKTAAELGRHTGVRVLAEEDERLVLAVRASDPGAGDHDPGGAVSLLGPLFTSGAALDGVTIEPPSLNGLFLKLTGRELRD